MQVDEDVFAFRMRQRNDFACSCSGTEIVHDANSEKLNLFPGLQQPPARANVFDAAVSDHTGGGIAEQLAIYSLPLGLLAAGGLIDVIGFAATGTLYAARGAGADTGDRAALARRFVACPRAGECEVTIGATRGELA